MSGTMNETERLIAIEAIKQLKARYFRCMDTKDYEGFEAVFAPDVVVDMRGETHDESGLIVGAAKFVAFNRSFVEDWITVHHGHMPEIEITSPITATGIWAMEDKLWKKEGVSTTLNFTHLHGYGHYYETYELSNGKWLLKTMKLIRIRVDAK